MKAGRGLGPKTAAAALCGVAALAVCGRASAAEPRFDLDIPPQPRLPALLALARQTGLSIGFPGDLVCRGTGEARGRLTAAEALEGLLRGSGCRAVRLDARTYAVQRDPAPAAPRREPDRPPPVEPARASAEEIVVTATKREMALSRAPYALSALGAGELAAQGIASPHALATVAAGITVTNLGPGRDKVILRGLSDSALTGHTQSTVGIYLDDLRLTYNAPDPDLPWIDVARVEVLRGPQGSLYGSGSIGGVLHVVSEPPDPTARSGWLRANAAATQNGQPSSGLEGVLNQPIGAGQGAIRLVGWWEETGGDIDNLATGRRDVDKVRRHGARLSAQWRLSPDLSLTAWIAQQTITARDAHYAQPPSAYARDVPMAEPHGNDFLAADVALDWTPPWAEVTINTGILEHDAASRYDASRAPAALAPVGDRPLAYDDDNDIEGIVTEARAVSRRPGRLRWLIGAFAAFGQQDLAGVLTGASGRVGYQEQRRDRLLETALFGEASYDLSSKWTMTAGARLFRNAVRTGSVVNQGAAARRFGDKTDDAGLAPKLVLAYRPNSTVTFYLQAAEGYRSGGFNTSGPLDQAFGVRPGDPEPLRRYAADELWSLEGGVRWRPLGPDLRLRSAVFYASWRDIQADLILPTGLPFTANIGDGGTTGVELEASYARGGLSLGGNLVAQDPVLDRPDPGFPGRADSGLPGVPRIAFGVSAAYVRALAGGWSLDLASRFAYVGHSRLTFESATAPRMGGYGNLRLSAALRAPSLKLEAYLDNATDDHGDTFAYGNPFTLRLTPQSTPQRPRTAGVALTRWF